MTQLARAAGGPLQHLTPADDACSDPAVEEDHHRIAVPARPSDAEGGGLQYFFPGGLLIGAGALVALPGTIMWPLNQRKMNRLKPTLTSAPAGSMGGGLGWSF